MSRRIAIVIFVVSVVLLLFATANLQSVDAQQNQNQNIYRVPGGLLLTFSENDRYAYFLTDETETTAQLRNTLDWLMEHNYTPVPDDIDGYHMFHSEYTNPRQSALISTEVAIIVAVAVATVTGSVAFWALRKRR